MPLSRDYNKADLNPIGFEQDKAIPAFSGTRIMSDVNTKQQLMNRISELERRNAELEALDARRQSVEEALRDSEMRFRSLAQSAVDAIISINSEDKIIFWNKGAERIFGYSEEEVVGRSVIMLIPESLREAHHTGVRRYLATGERRLIGKTAELQGHDQRWNRVSTRTFPFDLENERGNILHRNDTGHHPTQRS